MSSHHTFLIELYSTFHNRSCSIQESWLICYIMLIFFPAWRGHVVHLYQVCYSRNWNIQVHIIKNNPNVNTTQGKCNPNTRKVGHVLTALQGRGGSWIHMLEALWCCSCSSHCGEIEKENVMNMISRHESTLYSNANVNYICKRYDTSINKTLWKLYAFDCACVKLQLRGKKPFYLAPGIFIFQINK